MEKLELKKKLLNHCLQMLQDRVDNAKKAMDELQESANEYGIPRDRYDSFRAQALRKRDLFAEQYQRALDEIQLIEKIDIENITDKVQFGSIVITNKQKMIISVSLGKLVFENDTYFAISPQVPIFNVLNGLGKEDKFEFNGNKFEILDVF